jgi:polysaccharide export outer membrane protein
LNLQCPTPLETSCRREFRRRIAPWLGLVLSTVLLCGCNINGPTSTYPELGEDANTRGFGRLYPQDPNNEFTFGVGDSLIVSTPETPEFAGEHVIRSDGKITIPYVGEVMAAGLTAQQLTTKVETALAILVREPQLTISVGTVVSKAYFVAAQDPRTGGLVVSRIPYTGDKLVFEAWVEMGAPSTLLDADTHVKVIRGDPRNPVIYTINVREILMLGRTGANIQIRPDDIVFVPPTLFGYVNRFVAGIATPFESLFRISRSVVELESTVRIIQGDDVFSRGRRF